MKVVVLTKVGIASGIAHGFEKPSITHGFPLGIMRRMKG
jgi:hypothetical protein